MAERLDDYIPLLKVARDCRNMVNGGLYRVFKDDPLWELMQCGCPGIFASYECAGWWKNKDGTNYDEHYRITYINDVGLELLDLLTNRNSERR